MKLLDEYFKIQEEIYKYFGYVEDWVVIPLNDSTEYYWALSPNSITPESVIFSEEKESLNKYRNEIYTQRFLPKWIYKGKEYTMICVDTHTDGNKFLQIFDNKKEIRL